MDLGKWLKDRKKDVEKRWQNSTVLDAVSANTEADKARRAQQVAQGNPLSVNQQASQTYGSGLSAPVNRVKDLFSANTQADAMKRLSQTGLSESYDQQQKRLTDEAVNTQSNRTGLNQFARSGLSNVVNRVSKFPSDAGNLLAAASKSDILQNVPILGTVSKFDQATGNKGADFTQRKAKQLDQFTTNKLQQSQLGERKGENKTINMVGQLTTDLPLQAATGGYGSAVIGANMASSEYNKARDAGKSNDYALAVGVLQGGASALSEKYGIDKFLPGNGVTGNIVTKAGKRFLTEGAQEAQQQFTQNLITNKTYDPNQSLKEGVAQSAVMGGLAGAGMSPVLDLAAGVSTGAKPSQPQAPPVVKQQVAQAKPVLQQTGIPARPGSLRERIQVAKDNVTNTIASSITPMDQNGFVTVGRTPKNIHPDDQAVMDAYIAHTRGYGAKLSESQATDLELTAMHIADRYGMGDVNTLPKQLATIFDKRLIQDNYVGPNAEPTAKTYGYVQPTKSSFLRPMGEVGGAQIGDIPGLNKVAQDPLDSLKQEARKYKSADEFKQALTSPDVHRGGMLPNSYLKTPKKLYRGVSSDGSGVGSAGEGLGLYTTTDKKTAMGYAKNGGKLLEMNPATDIPTNPLYFRNPDAVRSWVAGVAQKMGMRVPEFNEKVGIENLVNSLGHDGVAFDLGNGTAYAKYANNIGVTDGQTISKISSKTNGLRPKNGVLDNSRGNESGSSSILPRANNQEPSQLIDLKDNQSGSVQIPDFIANIADRIKNSKLTKNEGGYAKNPFYDKKNDIAQDLTPEQSDFINNYANMLEDMGSGNGVTVNPETNQRVSSNYRNPELGSGKVSKAEWFDQARKELESGKGAYGASEDYKALATPQVGKTDFNKLSMAELNKVVNDDYKRLDRNTLVTEALEKYPSNPKATKAQGEKIVADRQKYIDGAIKSFNEKYGTDFEDMSDLLIRENYVRDAGRTEISDFRTSTLFGKGTPDKFYTNGKYAKQEMGISTPETLSTLEVPKQTKPLPSISTRIAESKKKTTSSSSSLATSPETSVSSPRSSGQETLQSTQPTQKTQVKKLDSPQSSQALSYNNSTPKSTKVKLNTSRLNPDSGYAGMAEMDKQTSEVIESLSNKDIVRLSKDAGIDTKTNSPEQVKKKIAEQLNVRRDAVKYMNDAEVARKSGDTKLAQELMLKAAEQGKISRAQGSELAQQLQARRIIANELDTPQQRLFKLLDAAGVNQEAYVNRLAMVDFNDGKQVIEAYRDLVPAKKAEWLDTVRYNSMLSSPLTQVVNIFSNAQGVLGIAPIEKTIRGSFDAIAGTFGKERQYAAGEGLAYSKGAVTNLRNATIEFKNALTGTGKYANPDFQEYSIPLATKGMSGATYKALLFPMRVLDGMDKFFRTMASAGEESALNLREKKGIKLGGNKQALMEGEAAYRVFQQELNIPGQGVLADASDSFAGLVMSGRNSKNPVVSTMSKFTVPFVKTINNINKQGMIEYSPLGVVNMIGNTDKVTALTRATMGTAVFGLSSLLLAAGDMTWGEPRGPEERARFRSEGKQPYAVKIGGKWVGFSKLHPAISFPMAMTSAIDDAMKDKKLDQGNVDAIMEAVSKYGNFLSDQSYAKSVGDMLGAIGGDKEAVARAVSNNIQQVVPFRALTGWMGRMTDDLERKVDTSKGYFDQQVELLMQQYPGLRQKTNTRDYKGQPIPANNPVLNGISPVRITDDRGVDPLDAEMDKLKAANEKDPLLSDVQVKDVDKVVESRLSDMQRQLVNSADYQNLSDKDKASKLSKIKTDLKAVERKKYMAENQVGEYSPTFSGKESKLTADQRALAGGNFELSRYGKSSTEATDYATKYKDAVSAFERDKNTLSPVQRSIKQKELRKLGVQKDYDNDTVSLHGMSKKDVYGLVSSDENGNDLVKKLLAYDDALVKSGVLVYNKWRDKNGNPDIAPRVAGGKGGKKSDGTLAANSLTTDTLQKLNSLLAGTQKPVTGARKVAVKKATLKKITVKK